MNDWRDSPYDVMNDVYPKALAECGFVGKSKRPPKKRVVCFCGKNLIVLIGFKDMSPFLFSL